ncbi:hypothetical protein [Deinococcus soli (ex Cha et al. 2016)]|uniref:Uncharacterized protein n=2 Tax=Deinococcus soli (ex Cha et al. 2016) TaxID=1309411 RepID=A0ACC6KFM6_9DEIO|nr:hypothetical protein [Deinococcus soli (ex Cha et al. 2016)]MDR6218307.1 hypothetical protein [Deinococcus soli (ex Cha et al. 2016)]MDR6329047.1 hypothetical protein [Deinococcus soli (ex Cha et al. 2016)]MDR6751320.1 hypothetical protein [Deinococcus soli (ex Cha et al. 2016)]
MSRQMMVREEGRRRRARRLVSLGLQPDPVLEALRRPSRRAQPRVTVVTLAWAVPEAEARAACAACPGAELRRTSDLLSPPPAGEGSWAALVTRRGAAFREAAMTWALEEEDARWRLGVARQRQDRPQRRASRTRYERRAQRRAGRRLLVRTLRGEEAAAELLGTEGHLGR